MATSNLERSKVAIIKGESSKEGVLNGFTKLGGISDYIDKGDQVFLKINLNPPCEFPNNVHLELIEGIIRSCNDSGAKKIYIGSFPLKGFCIKEISDSLGLEHYFKNINAELSYLDNSNYFYQKKISSEKLKNIKEATFTTEWVNEEQFKIPKVIIDSNKLISINQVNVHPIFDFTISLLNSYSMVPNNYQEIEKKIRQGKDYLFLDQYKKDLTSRIIDVFTIKKPDLVINDLTFLLEGAGPQVYMDSKLKKTGIVIVGNNALSVDFITLKMLNSEPIKNDLILEARERSLGSINVSDIEIFGEYEDVLLNVEPCVSKLTDLNIKNVAIKMGQSCSGCQEQAYYLLNQMKTIMIKDLKYISKNSFLIGENPLEPDDSKENTLIFGNCAIKSTKDRNFRKFIKKEDGKEKKNKRILEFPGCPPNPTDCILKMVQYFKKSDIPALYLLAKIFNQKLKKKIADWEVL